MKSKKILLLFVMLIFLAGCTVAKDSAGNIIMITPETTFMSIFETEGWFSTLFVYPISQSINYLTPIIGVGLAIAILTFLVNLIVFLLTFKSSINAQVMQELQPEIDKINQKYQGKTDQVSRMNMTREMQELWKKHNVNPFGTMLVTFIQFPIIIAMYQAVQRSIAVTQGEFLGMKLSVTPLNGIKEGNFLFLALFIVMVIVQIASVKLPTYLNEKRIIKKAEAQHKKPNIPKNPNQNMVYYMLIPISLLSISWPSAMTLYWIISSFVNILKSFAIHHIIHKKGVK